MEAYVGLISNENENMNMNMNIKMPFHNISIFKMCMCYLSQNSNKKAIIQLAFSFSNTKCDHINLKMKNCLNFHFQKLTGPAWDLFQMRMKI